MALKNYCSSSNTIRRRKEEVQSNEGKNRRELARVCSSTKNIHR